MWCLCCSASRTWGALVSVGNTHRARFRGVEEMGATDLTTVLEGAVGFKAGQESVPAVFRVN